MHDRVVQLAGSFVTTDRTVEQEFEARLAESSTLAFRVAYSVLRHRQDAEDVAQEAFVKAYRCFSQLRNREQFRAWLVRMTWRLALDRRRGDRRREARDSESAIARDARAAGSLTEDLVERERAAHLWTAIEAHDVSEVARLLALPEGTVKSRLFVARQRLNVLLQWMRTAETK